jgi:1-acyl-sn-glycerol-3-phosphate acyltransferase
MFERSFLWKCLQVIARILTTALFDLKVDGQRHIPARGGVLIVSNHQGYLDAVVLAVRLTRPLNYIAKSELFENPYGAWLLRSLNAFPVHQGAGDITAVKETIHRLQLGLLLNIFPEGARTEDGRIGQLRDGAALVVHRAGVPIIPAVITGSFEAWSIHRKVFRSWPVRVRFGPAMDLADLSLEEITSVIDRTLRTMFEELQQAE